MIRIAKFLFAVGLGIFIHAHFTESTKSGKIGRDGKLNHPEKNRADAGAEKTEQRKRSLFDPPEPPPRKEVVLFLQPGQVSTSELRSCKVDGVEIRRALLP